MNWTRKDLPAIAALAVLGSCAFLNLLIVPAFEDEGTQMRWIHRIVSAGEWLQPLNAGKPLEAWPMVPWVLLGLPVLTVVRALHVFAGIVGAVLTYRLARALAGRRLAFASGALFALCPFSVYVQRFALSDVFLCSSGIWVLVSVTAFIESPTWRRAAALAAALVLAAMCKLPVGFVFVIAMPVALLLMPAHERRQLMHGPASLRLLSAHVPVILLAASVVLVAAARMRHGQSPGFGLKEFAGIGLGRYIDIPSAIGVAPVSLADELATQLSWTVVVIASTGLLAGAVLNDWRQRWLIAVGAAPLLGIGMLAAFWFPRYLLFPLPPLIVGAVCGWHRLLQRSGGWRPALEVALWTLCAGVMGQQSELIIFKPMAARWSPVDRFQYFEGWGSGYGYPQAAQFVLAAADAPPMIYSLDGHSAYQLLAYLPPTWSSRVSPIFYGSDGQPLRSVDARLVRLLDGSRAWIIISEQLLDRYLATSFGRANLDRFALRRIVSFDKPGFRSQLAIYEATGIMSAEAEPAGERP